MERCECLPLNSKFARKCVLVKKKPFNRQTVISVNQLFKVLSTGTNICLQPCPPLINGLVDDTVLELSPDKLTAASERQRLVWVTGKEISKFNRTVRLIYPRRCTPISIKIGSHFLKLCTKVFWCVF